ncbi:phosphoenolpyruvate carboxykinase [Tripterygium wilfordii]|uniref:Phosphoenolpyruvate carboxykinase n=1 Tax=Tripterygium wilfordii TaxID=458696 RepID=A0A7J7CD66_TRIWF|nr:phosphoenolpyruvate carboxykinase [Tripterygium wilfordii]
MSIHEKLIMLIDLSQRENTRASYPIEHIPNAKIPCVSPHPKNVILLACDAFDVLPPISKLTLHKRCTTSSVGTQLWWGKVEETKENTCSVDSKLSIRTLLTSFFFFFSLTYSFCKSLQ